MSIRIDSCQLAFVYLFINLLSLQNKSNMAFLKAFGSENYRLAVSAVKYLATLFATSSSSGIAIVFTAHRNARIASAVLAIAIPPSICLSYAGIVSKRRNVARCSLHSQIAKCV